MQSLANLIKKLSSTLIVKLVYRYLFSSTLFLSLGTVSLFAFILVTGNVLKDVLGEVASGQLGGTFFSQLLLLLIPYVFAYALPLGTLTGILIVLGRLSSLNEMTTLKASGYSLWRLSSPIFLVALLGVLFSFFVNNYHAPKAKREYRTLVSNMMRDNPLNFVSPQTFIDQFPGYIIYAGRKKDDTMGDFWIWKLDKEGKSTTLLRAEKGWFTHNEERDILILHLRKGFTELSNNDPGTFQSGPSGAKFKKAIIELPLNTFISERRVYLKRSAMTLPQLLQRETELENKLSTLSNNIEDKRLSRSLLIEKMRVRVQMQKNFVLSFSTLALTFIGIPLSLRIGRKETYTNVAIALGLALTYQFLIIVISWIEKQPHLRPDLLIWVPNILFQTVGVILMIRANKH